MSSPITGGMVESTLLEAFRVAEVEEFQQAMIFSLQIRRLDHICHVRDREFLDVGLSYNQVRHLRNVLAGIQKRDSRRNVPPPLVYVKNENVIDHNIVDPKKVLIPVTQIALLSTIGQGTFSVVKRGLWRHPSGGKVDVALKILRGVSQSIMDELLVEASHLLKLQHNNVIRLYGIVDDPKMLVFELCEGGELLTRLRDASRPAPLLTTLFGYCLQIVKALAFLESKQYVHRDVAARNILLTRDERVVKLCDFGLMRALKENERTYIMHSQNRVPFSWCPPEALRYRRFSHASDVWAFGVTLWEIFSYGEDPWIGCRAIDVSFCFQAGERLEKPRTCSKQIYDVLCLCWHINPDRRPKFTMLRRLLLAAEFTTAEVRDAVQSERRDMLKIEHRDRIIVVENNGMLWYGQNEQTRKFGTFLRSAVFVHGNSVPYRWQRETGPSYGNNKISLPIRGSFIHAAHGDVLGGESWGTPDKIDEIYLNNPVVGNPLDFTVNDVSIITHSIAGSSVTSQPTPNVMCLPSTSKKSRDPFKVDWDDAFDVASFDDYFSPMETEPAMVDTKARKPPFSSRPPARAISYPSSPADTQQPSDGDTSVPMRPEATTEMECQANQNTNFITNLTKELSSEVAANHEKSAEAEPSPRQEPQVLSSQAEPTVTENDPFEISDSVKKAVHNERYNDILEKKADESKGPLAGIRVTSSSTTLNGNAASLGAGFNRYQTPQPAPNNQAKSNEGFRPRTRFDRKEHQPSWFGVENACEPNFVQKPDAVTQLHDSKQSETPQDKVVTSEKPTVSSTTEANVSKSSAEGKNRAATSNSLLDETRRSRVESEISKVLPPPSDLFFGKVGGLVASSPSVLDRKDEDSSETSPPVLSFDSVLEPIRLPITSSSPQPSLATVSPSTQQFSMDLSGNLSRNQNSIWSQAESQRQIPLFSLSSNPVMTSGAGTTSFSNHEPHENGALLPPRLEPLAPFQVEEGVDLLEALDPLSAYSLRKQTRQTPSSTSSSPITRAEEMKIFYADASFTSRSRCD
ncbi:hypothetical protein Angca_007077, partial [Angiostrongylus cantonensis]